MKKILTIFALIGLAAFQACEGPEGPIGPPGEPGLVIVGTTYEETVSFNATNDYTEIISFDQKLVESDALLIYRLAGVDAGRDVWRLLPQTYFLENGVLTYNFDYTVDDFSVFLDGTVNRSTLNQGWITDQVFRIIVVPSDFPAARIDYSDYDAVTKMLGITDDDFKKSGSKEN